MKKSKLLLCLAALCAAACTSTAPSNDVDGRVEALLARMSIEEKVGQLNLITPSDTASLHAMVREGLIGSIINITDPEQINALQHMAVEQSRLGIPILVGRDVIHGFHTLFPIPLGQAATFDTKIVEQGARIAAVEASAVGIRWTFSPMVDIARDARWGRIAEGSGEDPYLSGEMGAAMVRGYQTQNLSDPTTMAACVKHFAGYGASEGGRDYNTTKIPMRELRNFYLPPFEATVKAGAATLMTSFNEIDGIPSTANPLLLRDILRTEWGFTGMVVTDWNSSGEMIAHGFAEDNRDAACKSINAGVDMDMMSFGYLTHLKELVVNDKVSQQTLDEAVRNVLRLKFELGLFDNPYVDPTLHHTTDYAPAHLAAATQCVEESTILLKNNGVLPLKGTKTLLVTGPMADAPHDQLGTWSFDGESDHTRTPLAALRESQTLKINYLPTLTHSRDRSTAKFAALTAAARDADAVVVFVGEEAILSGEAHSLSSLDLQGAQSELLAAAHKSGKPVVAVIMAGRPLTIERDLANCDAVLYMFHPGTMGGDAVEHLLTGAAVPSGKTPVTFLRTVGQAPMYYNCNSTGRPVTGNETLLENIPLNAGQTSLGCTSFYLDSGWEPLFPFGYGLSYTTFKYTDPVCDNVLYAVNDVIGVDFTLTNTGKLDATEVVQLYVRDITGSITRPVKELKRFNRVELKAGESRKLHFELPVEELAFYGADNTRKVESGKYQLWVAGDSRSGNPVAFGIE